MARLKAFLLAIALAWASPAAADPLARWHGYIAEAAQRFDVPVAWVRRVMKAESAGRTSLAGRPITSHAGAMGLMQLMPGTWREMRAAHGLGADPHDPRDNILAGTAYLRAMYDRFGYPGLFAAYNAGPARYANHLRTGRRLPAETVAYVAAVASGDISGPATAGLPPAMPKTDPLAGGPAVAPASLFAVLGEERSGERAAQVEPGGKTGGEGEDGPDPGPVRGLFVPLRQSRGR